MNPFLVNLLEYSREEFIGKELWDFGFFKDIEASKAAFRELKDKQYVRYDDLPLKTKDGRAIHVEFVSNVYGVNSHQVIQCNVRDITKRKYAERSEQQLGQAQKMEAIGQLAGGVAHDFNNLLGVILGYCEILEGQLNLPELNRQMMIGEIHRAGISARDLTRHLLAFSRRQVLQPVLLNLDTTLNRLRPMLSRLIGDDIEVVSVPRDDLGNIKADPTQIEQVLMNLVANARDAMHQGGKITIETANVEIDAAYAQQHPSAKIGPYVMLAVSDTGVGIAKEIQSHIFEPFFSTKAGKGTGLGLATVFGIVKQSAGTISLYSEPGHGTTFKIYFPRSYESSVVIREEKAKPVRGGSETLLLVDDAGPLRELTRRLLEDCGYTVLDSGNPLEAIRMAEQYKGALPLLITDVVMPGLSGPALAKRLTATRPEIRVLYASGYNDDAVFPHGELGPNCGFLEKPYTRDDLARKVRELLDSPLQQSAA